MPGELMEEIDKYLEGTGMPLIEFIRRACREKLNREAGGAAEGVLSKEEIEQLIDQKVREIFKGGV